LRELPDHFVLDAERALNLRCRIHCHADLRRLAGEILRQERRSVPDVGEGLRAEPLRRGAQLRVVAHELHDIVRRRHRRVVAVGAALPGAAGRRDGVETSLKLVHGCEETA
jgi:hypothetical protein